MSKTKKTRRKTTKRYVRQAVLAWAAFDWQQVNGVILGAIPLRQLRVSGCTSRRQQVQQVKDLTREMDWRSLKVLVVAAYGLVDKSGRFKAGWNPAKHIFDVLSGSQRLRALLRRYPTCKDEAGNDILIPCMLDTRPMHEAALRHHENTTVTPSWELFRQAFSAGHRRERFLYTLWTQSGVNVVFHPTRKLGFVCAGRNLTYVYDLLGEAKTELHAELIKTYFRTPNAQHVSPAALTTTFLQGMALFLDRVCPSYTPAQLAACFQRTSTTAADIMDLIHGTEEQLREQVAAELQYIVECGGNDG